MLALNVLNLLAVTIFVHSISAESTVSTSPENSSLRCCCSEDDWSTHECTILRYLHVLLCSHEYIRNFPFVNWQWGNEYKNVFNVVRYNPKNTLIQEKKEIFSSLRGHFSEVKWGTIWMRYHTFHPPPCRQRGTSDGWRSSLCSGCSAHAHRALFQENSKSWRATTAPHS